MILALFISFVAFKKHYGNIISYALVEKKRVGLYYSGFWVILLFGKFDNYVVTSTYNFALFKNIYFLSRIAKVGLEKMRKKLLTDEGKVKYFKRQYTIEPIFGHMKYNIGYRSFLLRGLEKVNGEFKLMSIGWNLKKLLQMKIKAATA